MCRGQVTLTMKRSVCNERPPCMMIELNRVGRKIEENRELKSSKKYLSCITRTMDPIQMMKNKIMTNPIPPTTHFLG